MDRPPVRGGGGQTPVFKAAPIDQLSLHGQCSQKRSVFSPVSEILEIFQKIGEM